MKQGPVNNLHKRNMQREKNLTVTSFQQTMTASLSFQKLVDLEQSRTRILDASFII